MNDNAIQCWTTIYANACPRIPPSAFFIGGGFRSRNDPYSVEIIFLRSKSAFDIPEFKAMSDSRTKYGGYNSMPSQKMSQPANLFVNY